MKFPCNDCKKCVDKLKEYYMVADDTWYKVAKERELLCVGCLEKRLGRKLMCRDFTLCPINMENVFTGSRRLKNRINVGPASIRIYIEILAKNIL